MNAGRSRRCNVAVGRGESQHRGGRSEEGENTGVEGFEGTEAGGVETKRADTEWKESTERGVDSCARKRSLRAFVCGFTRSRGETCGKDDGKGRYCRAERENSERELERKEELKDETKKDGA